MGERERTQLLGIAPAISIRQVYNGHDVNALLPAADAVATTRATPGDLLELHTTPVVAAARDSPLRVLHGESLAAAVALPPSPGPKKLTAALRSISSPAPHGGGGGGGGGGSSRRAGLQSAGSMRVLLLLDPWHDPAAGAASNPKEKKARGKDNPWAEAADPADGRRSRRTSRLPRPPSRAQLRQSAAAKDSKRGGGGGRSSPPAAGNGAGGWSRGSAARAAGRLEVSVSADGRVELSRVQPTAAAADGEGGAWGEVDKAAAASRPLAPPSFSWSGPAGLVFDQPAATSSGCKGGGRDGRVSVALSTGAEALATGRYEVAIACVSGQLNPRTCDLPVRARCSLTCSSTPALEPCSHAMTAEVCSVTVEAFTQPFLNRF